jgi:flagellar biosynthesis protein
VTSPDKTPLAVALTYEAPHAPRVVAVGRGDLGQKIIDTAREHGVPLEINAPLAEALSTIELETEIPEPLYEAMAVILAFILRASQTPAAPPLRP